MNETLQVIIYSKREQYFTSYEHPISGKRIREAFPSRRDAKAHKQKIEDMFLNRKIVDYHKLPLEELIIAFMNENPRKYSFKKKHFNDFAESFGDMKIDEITSEDMKEWLKQVQLERNIKEISLRGVKCEIDAFFKYLVEKEIISESPLSTVFYKKHITPLKARNLLSEIEIKKLLEAAKDYSPGYLYPLLKMFSETAARPFEVLALTWKNIDLKNKTATFPETKKSRARTINLSDELVEELFRKDRNTSHVFMTYYKEPFTNWKLARLVNEFKMKGEYNRDFVPTDLRHSYAINFIMKGGDMGKLAKILGHYHVKETKRLYGEATRQVALHSAKPPTL